MAIQQRNRIGDILVKAKVIDDLQLRSAMAHVDQWGGRLTAAVLDLNLADEDKSAEAISKALNLPRAQLGNIQKDPQALSRIDVQTAEQNAVFPIALRDNGKTLHVAFADPTNMGLLDELGRKARARVVPYIAGEVEISHAISRHYRGVEPSAAEKLRRKPKPDATDDDDSGDEFKITDMNGKTVMKRLSDIDPSLAKAAGEVAAKPAPPVDMGGDGGGAGDLLDDLMGTSPAVAAQLSDADWQRVVAVKSNQEKSAVILRALTDLLAEKGHKRK
ncbi:MAG: hypothetical protein ACJ790_22725 [Myxococcaceae bacterium]